MDHFIYRDRVLHCEDVPVRTLAETYGTPLYVYSKATLLHHLLQIQQAFAAVDPLICYSVKTNGNLALCRLMAENGLTPMHALQAATRNAAAVCRADNAPGRGHCCPSRARNHDHRPRVPP